MTIESHERPRFAWIDYGRILSALAVLGFHYFSDGIRRGLGGVSVERWPLISAITDYGYLGVDFFFIVSGFVIFISAAGRTPGQFAASRFVRLYPAFIVCMTVTAVTQNYFDVFDVTVAQYFANLTMVPTLLGYWAVDSVYWTLLIEIAFYSLVFFAIVTGAIKRPRMLLASATATLVVLELVGIDRPIFDGYAPLFAVGCALSLLYRRWDDWIAWSVLFTGTIMATHAAYYNGIRMQDDYPHLLPYIPAIVTVAFVCIFLGMRGRDVANVPRAKAAGALTYPLYLLHTHLAYVLFTLVQTEQNKWFVTPLAIAGSLLLAWLVTRYVEEALRGVWKRLADSYVRRPIDAAFAR